MPMRVINTTQSADVGACLQTFGELLKESNIQFEVERDKSHAKGEAVVIAVALHLLSHIAWDLLKAAVARHLQSIKGNPKISVGGKEFDIKKLPNDPPIS